MNSPRESHPWMFGFSVGTTFVSFLLFWAGYSIFTTPEASKGFAVMLFLVGGLLLWGVMWIGKVSDNFSHWSLVPDGQKLFGYLILLPGVFLGIFFVIALSAIGVESNRRD